MASARLSSAKLALSLIGAVTLAVIIPASTPAQILQYADRAPDHMESLGGNGMLILYDAGADGRWLNKVEVYASHQGGGEGQEFQLYVVDLEGRLLREISLPVSVWGTGEADWHDLPLPPVQVPQDFGVGLSGGGPAGGYEGYGFDWNLNLGGVAPHFQFQQLIELPEPVVELRPGKAIMLERLGGRRVIASGSVRVGSYDVAESHSYRWLPGTAGEGLWSRDWMVRAYVDAAPDGDPQATDLVILNTGEAFFDRIVAAGGDPLDLQTAAHGALPWEEVASIRLEAVRSPAMSNAVIELANGRIIEGMLTSLDEETARIHTGDGGETSVPRSDIARIDFRQMASVPIAEQVEPAVSETRRGFSPEQATGPPDTHREGDIQTAWATREPDGGQEWLLLTYDTAVDIAEVRIWETYNPGAVTKVTAIPEDGEEVVLWEGQDPTTKAPGEFVVPAAEEIHAKKVKVYLDTTLKNGWNEIDAVELVAKDGTRQWASSASASSSYADR
jgi:hypothetical protein